MFTLHKSIMEIIFYIMHMNYTSKPFTLLYFTLLYKSIYKLIYSLLYTLLILDTT